MSERHLGTYVHAATTHTHTCIIHTMYAGMTGVFKDNSMSKMKVGAPQLVQDYKPSEAGI